MEHFAGLDVSVKETSVCIVDEAGRITRNAGAQGASLSVEAGWIGSGTVVAMAVTSRAKAAQSGNS